MSDNSAYRLTYAMMPKIIVKPR